MRVISLLIVYLLAGTVTSVAAPPGTESSLEGFRYIYIVPPTYQNGTTDAHGFARLIAGKFAEDPSWTVLSTRPEVQAMDSARANETLIATFDHTWNGAAFARNKVTIRFYNALNEMVGVFDGSSGMGMSVEGDLKRAINDVVKKVSRARPAFNKARVVDLASRFDASERFEMDESSLRAYLDENSERLNVIEGIWTSIEGQYRLGIIRAPERRGRFVAFILESKHPLWKPRMVKARFDATAVPELFTANYFMATHDELGTTARLDGGLLTIPIEFKGSKSNSSFLKNYPTSADAGEEVEGKPQGSTGTGFAVAPGLIATCFHVVRDSKRIEIVFESSREGVPLEFLLKDEVNDLAILRVLPSPSSGYRRIIPLGLADGSTVRLGEDVYTIGYPLGDLLGESAKVTTGVVSALEGLNGDARTLQITAPVQPGNSGGPLFNSRGRVAGIVVSSLRAEALYRSIGAIPQNVNFAVRSDYLQTLLRQAGPRLPDVPASPAGDRASQVEVLRASVGQVRAFR